MKSHAVPVVLAIIEVALNKIIAQQAGIVDDVDDKLTGKSVCVHLDGVDLPLYFRFVDGAVYLSATSSTTADATIRGTPIALAMAALGGRAHTENLRIDGDLHVARAFEKLFSELDVDWEEIIARYAGDGVAFQVGEAVRDLRRWWQHSAHAFADDLRDYLHVEAQLLAPPDEVEQWRDAVDEVRAAVERFELRVRRLAARLEARRPTREPGA